MRSSRTCSSSRTERSSGSCSTRIRRSSGQRWRDGESGSNSPQRRRVAEFADSIPAGADGHDDRVGVLGGGERAHFDHVSSGGEIVGDLRLDLAARGDQQGDGDIAEGDAGAAEYGGRRNDIGGGG